LPYNPWDTRELYHLDYLDDGLPELSFHGALENARPFRGLLILLEALHALSTTARKPIIEEFSIRPSYEPGTQSGPGISYLLFIAASRPLIDHIHSLFTGLRRLNLVISNAHKTQRDVGSLAIRRGHLRGALQHAEHLEELTLELDELPALTLTPNGLKSDGVINPEFIFAKLKILTIVYGTFHANPLLDFLRNHRNILEDVCFHACRMKKHSSEREPQTWREILYRMQQEKLNFRSLVIANGQALDYAYDNTRRSQQEMRDFLLHDGPFPLDVMDEWHHAERFKIYDRYY
jgi:hypothetical protein